MSTRLRVAILEDSEPDAGLMLHELRRSGFVPDWHRVESEEDYLAALDGDLDLILADYTLPQFDALRALDLLKQRALEIPFIVVSGTIGEEIAVGMMKLGANDYILKDRLARLGPAVRQALEQKKLRDENRRADAALARSEARFRALIELTDAMSLASADGAILYASPAATRMLGVPDGSLVGRGTFDGVHPDDLPAARALFDELLGKPGATMSGSFRLRHRDGSWRWVQGQATNLLGEPAVGAMVANYRDVTDRMLAEEALRQSEERFLHVQKMEAVGRLAGGLAHDFNNLLTVISGYAELALGELGPGHAARKDVEEVMRAAQRAGRLTSQLLAASRRQVLQLRVLDLNAVICDSQKTLRPLIGEDIEMQLALQPGLGNVKADPGQIEQVVMNLAVNARDAMPAGGRITIETRNVDVGAGSREPDLPPGPYVMLAVGDTGSGISPEIRDQIFEPFFSTKERGKGTGLGLSIVYGIVRQSLGDVRLESELGRGTTFRIYLPRVEEPVREAPAVVGRATKRRGGETVLVVEDESGVRKFARDVLKARRYTVMDAGDGIEAIRIFEQHAEKIDLVITDIAMPELRGDRLAERLVARRPETKVLYVSGHTEHAFLETGLPPGTFFLQKPFTAEMLSQKVREVLDSESGPARA